MNNLRPPLQQPWYPKDPAVLRANIEQYLNNAKIKEPVNTKIYGIIVPHAGHIYSGQVAASAFKCIDKLAPELVVVVSPSHFVGGADLIVSSHDAYSTPFGNIEIDTVLLNTIIKRLRDEYDINTLKVANDPEHSIEVELPFLQLIYSDFKLIPVMIRNQSDHVCRALGHVLTEMLGSQNSILIASSDLSHYFNQKTANRMDDEIINRIEDLDPEAVLEADENGVGQACGVGAIASVLWAAKEQGAKSAKVMSYATSGDVTGDYDGVVGYVSVVLY